MLVSDQYDEDAPTVDDFLVNWVAPEVDNSYFYRLSPVGIARRGLLTTVRYLFSCIGFIRNRNYTSAL